MKLGLMLPEESTTKLLEVAEFADIEPLELIVQAIDTLYKAAMSV